MERKSFREFVCEKLVASVSWYIYGSRFRTDAIVKKRSGGCQSVFVYRVESNGFVKVVIGHRPEPDYIVHRVISLYEKAQGEAKWNAVFMGKDTMFAMEPHLFTVCEKHT